jgi:hypothetical protein
MGYIPPLALIKYTFEINAGTGLHSTVVNSGTAGTAGDGDISFGTTSVTNTYMATNPVNPQSISYNTTKYKRGTTSLYNNLQSTASSYVQVPSFDLGSKRTYCVWLNMDETSGTPPNQIVFPLTFEAPPLATASASDTRPNDVLYLDYRDNYKLYMNFAGNNILNYFDINNIKGNENGPGTWNHITVTEDVANNLVTLYTNGVKNTSLNVSSYVSRFLTPPYEKSCTFQRHISSVGGSYPFTNTSDFRIFSRGPCVNPSSHGGGIIQEGVM